MRTPRGGGGGGAEREGGLSREEGTMWMPDRGGREGTWDNRMCRAQREEGAAGILFGCGDCRNRKACGERPDQGREMQRQRSGERIPPRAFIRGVPRLCFGTVI